MGVGLRPAEPWSPHSHTSLLLYVIGVQGQLLLVVKDAGGAGARSIPQNLVLRWEKGIKAHYEFWVALKQTYHVAYHAGGSRIVLTRMALRRRRGRGDGKGWRVGGAKWWRALG